MNSVARSGVFAPRMLGRSHVPRFKLVSGISLHLERDGFLAMCCEPGMGCKTLVCDVAASLEARGFSTACAVIDVFVQSSPLRLPPVAGCSCCCIRMRSISLRFCLLAMS